MTKRLAIAAVAAVLGAAGLMAPAATAATPAITCGTHQQQSGTTQYSYFGNCEDDAVNIHMLLVYFPAGSDLPVESDQGDHCVPAQTDYLMGTLSTNIGYGGYAGTETGSC